MDIQGRPANNVPKLSYNLQSSSITETCENQMPVENHEISEHAKQGSSKPDIFASIAADCWSTYEKLTLNLKQGSGRPNTSNAADGLDPYENLTLNLKQGSDRPNTPASNAADGWDPYENLTLNLKQGSTTKHDVTTLDFGDQASLYKSSTDQTLVAQLAPVLSGGFHTPTTVRAADAAADGKPDVPAPTGYLEPAAEAAGKSKAEHWNPSKGDLNITDPSSWSKLQMYAGDVGRANHWDGKHQFEQINALRHALATAYITYVGGAAAALIAGDWHELHTAANDVAKFKPWSTKPQDIKDWKDHGIDINNNRAGAKIAQGILDKGGSWQDVENAVVDAVKHHLGKNGKIDEPAHRLHTFLGPH